MIPYLRLLFGGLLLAVLAACAGIPSDRSGTAQDQKAAALAEIPPISAEQPFHRQGRFAVHAERMNDKPEAIQGGFSWYDNGDQLVLELRNPLGHVMAQLQVDERGAWLQEPRAGMRFGESADALAQEIFDQPIPVEGLRYWLRGAPSPQASDIGPDDQGRLEQARDQGWRITLNEYDAQGPKRLLLVFHQGGQRITVRIVIDADPQVQ
ncbi:MAG TPA: lipoprotein insertase outer membrane protein LolB [Paenalcaligenes sp.]|nr:lipoprotein insertase outer membrane protein LolB [Paenalcaligenes sp.]